MDQKEYKTDGYNQPTVFAKFTKLAGDVGAANLGHGFPDWKPPKFFVDSLAKHVADGNYQYCPGKGIPRLQEAVSNVWSKIYGRKISTNEILIANGAVALLYSAFTAFLEKDDEVLTFEPLFDSYIPQVKFAGAKLVGIHLTAPKPREKSQLEKIKPEDKDVWTVDFDLLKSKINNKTRLLVINTPNNPTGKIFTYDELKKIAELIENYPRIIVITDEVYEFNVLNELNDLPRFQNLPGMWDRTISVHSAGKIFSVTGVRMGWAVGPERYIGLMFPLIQYTTFCIFEPFQHAFADSLIEAEKPYEGYENYYVWLKEHYRKSRNYLIEQLASVKGFDIDIFLPDGGFFAVAGISKHNPILKYNALDGEESKKDSYLKDYRFLINLANEAKVVGIPCSALCTPENKQIGENFIRLAFCKSVSVIEGGIKNLKAKF